MLCTYVVGRGARGGGLAPLALTATLDRRLGGQIDVWELKSTSGSINRRSGGEINAGKLKLTLNLMIFDDFHLKINEIR